MMSGNAIPKILLVTEAVLTEDSVGASRTLLNLLKGHPENKIFLLSPKGSFKKHRYLPPFNKQNIFFTFRLIRPLHNRFAYILNPIINFINLIWLEIQPLDGLEKVKEFAPDIVLATPLFKEGMIVARRVMKKDIAPMYVYLMDDWVTTSQDTWVINNLKKTTKEILLGSKWLMISPELRDCFANYFKIENPKCLVVHNPVEVIDFSPKAKKETFSIAYAGSIWEMHKDAIFIVASAVKALQDGGHNVALKLYCEEKFYTMDQPFWEQTKTLWGGMILYKELNKYLQDADLLLVGTSFAPQVSTLVKTSVLTKTTDYMNAGRAMLAVGPSYSATNKFVRDWNVGYVIESQDLDIVKAEILEIISSPRQNEEMAYNAWLKLKQNFSQEVIVEKLNSFFNNN